MYSLYFAGTLLEQLIGRWRFALLYLALGHRRLGGRARPQPERARRSEPRARSSAILGALFVLERRGNIATGGQIAGLIVLNLIFTFALSSTSRSAATSAA